MGGLYPLARDEQIPLSLGLAHEAVASGKDSSAVKIRGGGRRAPR